MISLTVRSKTASIASLLLIGPGLALLAPTSSASAKAQNNDSRPATHHDRSGPLRTTSPRHDTTETSLRKMVHADENEGRMPQHPAAAHDPVVQTSQPRVAAPATSASFEGVGNGFRGPQGIYLVNSAPPDTNSAVGPTQVVEIVNSAFAVFSKTGSVLYGPANTNTLWSGFGGYCESNNDGDGVVRYDSIANRWILTQFALASSAGPYFECIAVSQTGDATGAYYRYAFQFSSFPDYPKFGVWPDAYYMTYNLFAGGVRFIGSEACAMDRASMIAGLAASQQCFTTDSTYGGLLPADLDGHTNPPGGSPALILATGATATSLAAWNFHVDWATPGNSTFTGPSSVAIAGYSAACGGGTCIPQSGTNNQLDSLADRLMFRLAYRNFGDHQAWVVSHSVTAGSSTGVRWYELRPSGSTVSVFQQGTFAPDATYRWMSSIAMDKAGNIGLGYSTSSSSQHPGIAYTGRLASDALGVMTQGEGTVLTGAGSQNSSLHRWGDYSSMSVDPTDDCTFWYSTEYIPSDGSFNWNTRIASFAFPSCAGTTTNDFSIAASPASGSVHAGSALTSTISTTLTTGSAQSIALSASGLPSGATASFSPTSVNSGGSSTLTISTTSATAPGNYTVTVTGTGTSATHSTSYALTVTAPVTNDFSMAASPTSGSLQAGSALTSAISTTLTSGAAQSITFSASGLPSGATAAFSPTSVNSGGSSTLTISTTSATAAGTYTVTVTGTGPSATHSTSYALTVTAPVVNDFSIAVSPTSGSVQAGSARTATVSTALTTGFAQSITLSASGLPSGASAAFSPASVTSGTSSTMTISASTSTASGTYPVTVTGTGASATHSTTYTLTVTPATVGGAILNGGFETGTFASWTTSGVTSVSSSSPHSGLYSGQGGTTSPTNGTASIAQTFTAPSGVSKVSFWYSVSCPDTVRYDWATVTLRDNTAARTTTVLAKTCSNGLGWRNVTSAVVIGHSYTLTLSSHDDNYPGDPTYTQFDDVTLI